MLLQKGILLFRELGLYEFCFGFLFKCDGMTDKSANPFQTVFFVCLFVSDFADALFILPVSGILLAIFFRQCFQKE